MKKNQLVKIKISLILILTVVTINSFGQFIIPTPLYTEYQTSVTVSPYNTGNDILDYNGDNYAVSVSSDLSNAGLYWNYNNGAQTGYAYFAGGVTDIYHADVCLVVDQVTPFDVHAIVGWYYGGTGGIPSWYIEDYIWDGVSSFKYVTSTFVNGGFGTTLNIDGDDLGNFIMVYDENSTIYALTGDINGGAFNMNNGGNPVPIGINSGTFPDVSIYSDGITGNQIVHLTYVDGNNDLNIEYDTYSNIAANTTAFTAWTSPISPGGGGFVISNPRIASPNSSGVYDDWTVVWQEDDRTTAYYIKGLNSNAGSLSTIYTYNDGSLTLSNLPLNDVENWQPVVAYDYNTTPTIWVGWNFDNRSGYYNPGGGYPDVWASLYPIALKCDNFALPDPSFDYWQVPNYVTDDLEIYPLSLASRYADSDQLLLTYYLANSTPEVCNKITPSSSATTFKMGSNIGSTLPVNYIGDEKFSFILYDLKGNKVLEQKGSKHDLIKLQYENKLPAAMYFLQIISDNGKFNKSQKLFIK